MSLAEDHTKPPNPQSASHLARLPVELLNHTLQWVTANKDYSALRQTCKVIERKTFDLWAQRYFQRKKFSIYLSSLEVLLEISRHSKLRLAVTHVILSLKAAEGEEFPLQEQRWLINTGSWIQLLSRALSFLPNVITLDIRSAIAIKTKASESSTARHRRRDSECLLQGALLAVAESCSNLETLKVCYNMESHGVSDAGLYIPPAQYRTLQAVFSKLKRFYICLWYQTPPVPTTSPGYEVQNLCKLLSAMPNLLSLRIQVDRHTWYQPEQFWRWLAQPVSLGTSTPPSPSTASSLPKWYEDIPPVAFSNLDLLDIRGGTMDLNLLMAAVDKIPLPCLYMFDIRILDNYGSRKSEGKTNLARFIEYLGETDVSWFNAVDCKEVALARVTYHADVTAHSAWSWYLSVASNGQRTRELFLDSLTCPDIPKKEFFAQGASRIELERLWQ